MFKKLEVYWVELIRGKRKGLLPLFIKGILRLLSWPYQLLISGRNWAYDRGCLKQYYAPGPLVISIGNIVAGGTGKTPVTLMVAQEFYQDFILALLTRGYRSKVEHLSEPTVLSRGEGPLHPAAVCGDEPYLLAKNLPRSHVFVGKNRYLSSNLAAQAGAQLILLDDGMQHRRLARDYEIVVMDAGDPFGQGYFLPRGFLREGLSSLSRADLIILNHLESQEQFASIKSEIRKFTQAPLIGSRMEKVDILDLQEKSIDDLRGKKVGFFCAIAHPENFQRTVNSLGVDLVGQAVKADHGTFTHKELIHFCEYCLERGAERILCTEKDVVKLDRAALAHLPIAWVKMKLTIVEGKAHWENFIAQAKQDIGCAKRT